MDQELLLSPSVSNLFEEEPQTTEILDLSFLTFNSVSNLGAQQSIFFGALNIHPPTTLTWSGLYLPAASGKDPIIPFRCLSQTRSRSRCSNDPFQMHPTNTLTMLMMSGSLSPIHTQTLLIYFPTGILQFSARLRVQHFYPQLPSILTCLTFPFLHLTLSSTIKCSKTK